MNQNAAAGESKVAETIGLLERLKAEVFENTDEGLARGLGREPDEIRAWFSGEEEIDEDAEIKIHALALERLGDGEAE